MLDTQTDGQPTWKWAFPDQNLTKSTDVVETKQTPYEYFKITQDEAEQIVKSFVAIGGMEKWKEKQPRLHIIGAEKEVCLVGGEGENSEKSYAIKRGRNEEYRPNFPLKEMLSQKKALENNRGGFVPGVVIDANGGPYVVTRYVEGIIPTKTEIEEFQKKENCSITDDRNLVKNSKVGLVLLDIDDYRY